VAELVDAVDSKSTSGNRVLVRVRSSATVPDVFSLGKICPAPFSFNLLTLFFNKNMHLFKQIVIFLFVASIFTTCLADAALKYQQDFTISNWVSQESIEEEVRAFCNAAQGDPDIRVVNVKYTQKKENRKSIRYSAMITCYVSKIDEDLIRINGKVFQQKHGLM
jgi:hypothetical protein